MRGLLIIMGMFIIAMSWTYADTGSLSASLNISGNYAPIIIGTSRVPAAADITQDILFYVEAYDQDNDNITAYCQLYNGSTSYNGIITVYNITENVSVNICNATTNITNVNEQWHADIWVGDDIVNSSTSTTLSSSVGAFLDNLVNHTHENLTVVIEFDTAIYTNFTINYNKYNDSTDLNESTINTTQALSHYIILNIDPYEPLYFNISTFTNISGAEEIWGTYMIEYDCTENWTCTDWSACVGSQQTRICVDQNNCGTYDNQPIENQSCEDGGGGGGGDGREVEVEAPRPEYLLAGEPETCGNGVVDEGESYLNCNRDIPPTIWDYFKCMGSGRDTCVYYDSYAALTIILGIIGSAGVYLCFSTTGASLMGSLKKQRKNIERSSLWLKRRF